MAATGPASSKACWRARPAACCTTHFPGPHQRPVSQAHAQAENFYYLSGLLIGCELQPELATAPPPHLTVAGEPALLALYCAALQILEIDEARINTQDAVSITLRGQWAVLSRAAAT